VKTVASASPWVPPEWIAAHGLRPARVQVCRTGRTHAARGLCPYAAALGDAWQGDALVLPTSCDPMRYTAALLADGERRPVFLFNLPSTWQTRTARRIYADELARLGRFLVELGGREPADDQLTDTMRHFERQRMALQANRARLSARAFAATLTAVYGGATLPAPPADAQVDPPGVPLGLLGGPLVAEDYDLFDILHQAGGRIVFDGTEWSMRTWPAMFAARLLVENPLAALTAAYFDAIPDVFRRPNAPLFDWLHREVKRHAVRGLLVRRYVWCDLWHAEVQRLRAACAVPVLEIDVAEGERGETARTLGRLEAFLEMLR
jgi:benzoyl-CoA reductase/2-hydroxyglutaryl-CoA dehydratase subunit BcrC/BadD/HgdB